MGIIVLSYWGLNVHECLVWAHTNHSENLTGAVI